MQKKIHSWHFSAEARGKEYRGCISTGISDDERTSENTLRQRHARGFLVCRSVIEHRAFISACRCGCYPFAEEMIVLSDTGFHAKVGDPINLKICARGTWNVRMVVETVLSLLTNVCHFKKIGHRVRKYFQARLAFTMAAFNVLVQWHGFEPDPKGFVHLSIAEFGL